MVQSKNMSIFIVIAVAAVMLHSTEGANYIVGGSTGWRSSPPGGNSFYSNWAENITFRVNDVLVFNFATGSHTVAELTKANYDSCDVNQSIQVIVTSPARVTLNRTGDFYFSCTFQGHCGAGQKLSVNVIGSSPPVSGDTPSSPPSQGPSPPVSGTTPNPPPSNEAAPPSTEPGATPPSPSSATSVIATYSLLVITVVLNILF